MGEGGGVDVFTAAHFVGHADKQAAVQRPHGAADAFHQTQGQFIQGFGQAQLTAFDRATAMGEALGHVDAVIAVANRAVDFAEVFTVGHDDADQIGDDGAAIAGGKMLAHGSLRLGHADGTAGLVDQGFQF